MVNTKGSMAPLAFKLGGFCIFACPTITPYMMMTAEEAYEAHYQALKECVEVYKEALRTKSPHLTQAERNLCFEACAYVACVERSPNNPFAN